MEISVAAVSLATQSRWSEVTIMGVRSIEGKLPYLEAAYRVASHRKFDHHTTHMPGASTANTSDQQSPEHRNPRVSASSQPSSPLHTAFTTHLSPIRDLFVLRSFPQPGWVPFAGPRVAPD